MLFAEVGHIKSMLRYFVVIQCVDLHSQFQSSYYTFFDSCCYGTEKFRANLCFDSSECSVQTADGNNSYFTNTSVRKIFKLVLYFDSTIINNQIRYSVTAKRMNFAETQYSFQYAD